MLRKELGDSLFVRCLRTFYREYEYKNALTGDFKNIVEKLSGRDFTNFFDQWLYKAGHPVLGISWMHKDQSLVLNIKQLQPGTIFEFPLEFKIINKNSVSTQIKLDISAKDHSFTLDYPNNPIELIPDPGNWLLIEFDVQHKEIVE
jgi:aminopeptidase N